MIEGYDNRMLTAPRFVREGNRLIPESSLVRVKREDSEALDDEIEQVVCEIGDLLVERYRLIAELSSEADSPATPEADQ
ncbi:hypothetical protein J3454_14270 [Erythrobacter sp. NFXS35]|uniref:hypothetical protein n=1 Tax=Erythrobacter sp. NFXS35 TaxID=2818436 RepID=UPI0032DE6013